MKKRREELERERERDGAWNILYLMRVNDAPFMCRVGGWGCLGRAKESQTLVGSYQPTHSLFYFPGVGTVVVGTIVVHNFRFVTGCVRLLRY